MTAEEWARARIAGSVSTDEAFNGIAYNGGFPVITDDNTIIFMHWYEGGNWSVSGDFNNWSETAMTNNGDIWYVEVPKPANLVAQNHYKFVNNNQYQADHWSLRYGFDNNGEISYITKPDTAHLMRWHNFKSPQGLEARTIRAYVPAGDGPFDVLYAHDGDSLFGTGGKNGSWKVEENMAKAGASFIVVGIDNTKDRLSEYAFSDDDLTGVYEGMGYITGRGDDYARYVQETVRPFIESQFNVTTKAGLMGSSMGGLISLYIAHLYPDKYKAVLALSPTTAWGRFKNDNGRTIEDIYAEAGHRSFTLYLDNGGHVPDGGCPAHLSVSDAKRDETQIDCYCFTRSFVDKMDAIGYTWDVDLFHQHKLDAAHDEAAWSARLDYPLSIFKDVH
jgi:predicted alpha/beta superfamily hydrolase